MEIVGIIVKIIGGVVTALLATFFVGSMLVVFVVLGAKIYKTIKYAQGWVCQEKKCEAVKEFQKEENDCIYFINIWDNSVKTCGVYSVEKS